MAQMRGLPALYTLGWKQAVRGEHLVEDAPEGVNVRTLVELLTQPLFRCHVCRRPGSRILRINQPEIRDQRPSAIVH